MKKLIALTILSLFLLPTPLVAQETPESTKSNSLTNKIKERLQETAEEGLDTIRDEITSKSKTPKKKAFVGSIKSLNETTISLEYKSHTLNINLDDTTQIIKSSGKKDLTIDDLEIDDFIIAMGFVSPESEDLAAKRVLLISSPEPQASRQLLNGKINEIDGNKISIDSKSLVITNKTNLKVKDIKDPEVEDLELDDNLFAIVTLDQNGDIKEVNQVLVLPGKNNPAAQEPTNASESAQASESATIEE